MKETFLIIVLILITFVLWIFATATIVNGKGNNKIAFIARSISYWIAIIISFIIGNLLN